MKQKKKSEQQVIDDNTEYKKEKSKEGHVGVERQGEAEEMSEWRGWIKKVVCMRKGSDMVRCNNQQ